MTAEPLGHEQLLTLARKTEAAARDGDRHRLEAAALRLFYALVDHVRAEAPALVAMPAGGTHDLLRGQQRVLDLLVDLAAAAQAVDGICRCDDLARQLVAQLTVQASEEHHHLPAPGDGRTFR